MDHKHQHGLWHQHMLWTSAWSLVSVQTMDIYTALCRSMCHRHIIALSSSTGHGHRPGIRQWVAKTTEHTCTHTRTHAVVGPWTSTWQYRPLIIKMASGDNLDHRYLIWPPAVARLHTVGDTNIASHREPASGPPLLTRASDSHMVSSGSPTHRHTHEPWASTQPGAADHRYQHDFQGQHRP